MSDSNVIPFKVKMKDEEAEAVRELTITVQLDKDGNLIEGSVSGDEEDVADLATLATNLYRMAGVVADSSRDHPDRDESSDILLAAIVRRNSSMEVYCGYEAEDLTEDQRSWVNRRVEDLRELALQSSSEEPVASGETSTQH